RILDVFYKNRNSIEGKLEEPLIAMKNTVANLLKVSNAFNVQLQSLVADTEIPETSNILQERFAKAISYFSEQAKSGIETSMDAVNYTTDNKTVNKDIENQLDILEELLATKLLCFEGLTTGFNAEKLLK